jgi:two-component system response regulator MtrA
VRKRSLSALPLTPPTGRPSGTIPPGRNGAETLSRIWENYSSTAPTHPEDPMSAPALAPPATRRTRARLRPVPDPFAAVDGATLTVTISIDGGGAGRDRVLAALRDLVAVAGADADIAVRGPEPEPDTGLIVLDPKPRAAFRDGRLLDLSRLEYDLLLFFAEHPRQVFTRAQLLARVWGHVHAGARTVDVHISRLRTKLDDPELITTVYGVGYRLADGAPVKVAA